MRNRGPLKDLDDSKLIVYESKWFPWSSRINFILFRGPIFHKPLSCQELFLQFVTAKRLYFFILICFSDFCLVLKWKSELLKCFHAQISSYFIGDRAETFIIFHRNAVIHSYVRSHIRFQWYFVAKIVLTYCEKKIVLVIEKHFWNSRLKPENFQNFWDH